MILETERLILRPWEASDAEALFEFASDPAIGNAAGWNPHKSVEESLEIIKTVFAQRETYAVILKENMKAVGSVGLMIGEKSNLDISGNEAEIGYWIGKPYWGKGLIPEAVSMLVKYGFRELGLEKIWCGYFDGNEKSKRVQEKCGFKFHHTNKDIFWELTGQTLTEHVTVLESPYFY